MLKLIKKYFKILIFLFKAILPNAPSEEDYVAVSPQLKTHKIFVKSGDDLRQDQLIMQMISLMDGLLKKVNLDLKLVTYGILALSKSGNTQTIYNLFTTILTLFIRWNNGICN